MSKTNDTQWLKMQLAREKGRAAKWKKRAVEARTALETVQREAQKTIEFMDGYIQTLQEGAKELYILMQQIYEAGDHGYNPLCTASWCKCTTIRDGLKSAEEAGILGRDEGQEESLIITPGGNR